jgi:hypothetical protein
MASDVVIRITAVDNASKVLVSIGRAADSAGDQLKKAGAEAKQGMADVENSSKKADQALRTFERTSLAVGAAAGAAALAIVKVSAAYQQQARQIDAITRLYGDASQEVLNFAETIQSVTRFSNDAARESAVLLNTLTNNYGFSTDQIEQLIMRSSDLAALHGKTLTEVSQMVANALRGEGEYIEQIGVAMNQNFVASQAAARGIENFIGGLTDAEQAAFRFTLLMEQTATAQGYAMEQAEGTRGAVALLMNEFQDGAQAVGGMLGPVRDLAAEFNNYALWLPLIASQTARVSAILINSARSGEAAASAMGLLRFAISPLGVLLGTAAVAVGILGMRFLENKQSMAQAAAAAEMAAASYKTLQESIAQMYSSGNIEGADWVKQTNDNFQNVMNEWQRLTEEVLTGTEDGSWWEDLADTMSTGVLGIADVVGVPFAEEMRKGLAEAGEEGRAAFVEAMQITGEEEAQINQSLTRLFSLANNPNIDQGQFRRETEAFFSQLWRDVATGIVPTDQISEEIDKFYVQMSRQIQDIQALTQDLDFQAAMSDLRIEGLDELASDLEEIESTFRRAADMRQAYIDATFNTNPDAMVPDTRHLEMSLAQIEQVEFAIARIRDLVSSGDFDVDAVNASIMDLTNAFSSGKISSEVYAQSMLNLAFNMDEFSEATNDASGSVDKFIDKMKESNRAITENGIALKENAAQTAEEFRQNLEDFAKAQQELREAFIADYMSSFGMDDPLSKINLSSLRNEFTALAGDIDRVAGSMDTVFRVIVENTNAIGQQSQGIADWAEELINVQGEYGKIDDLIAAGAISQTEYNQAQRAYNDIARENAEIQQHILTIQAMQAPFIRDHLVQLENQMDALQGQSAEQQRVTLGWMDSATAAQAYTLVTQAAQIATGELGQVGTEAFHAMIEGAIAVNPFLFDMLETIGLVSGTPLDFTVNLEGVTEGISEIERLTMSIDALTVALGGTPPDVPINVDVTGQENLQGLIAELEGLDTTDREINVKVGMEMESGGGPLSGLFGDIFGGVSGMIKTAPITVPVIPEWQGNATSGDGTGGAGLDTLDPITVPVIPEVDTSAMQAAIPTGTIPGPTIQFQYDISLLSGAIASYSGVTVAGPIVEFSADTDLVDTMVGEWASGGTILGPIVEFGAEDLQPAQTLGEWVSKGTVTGPIVSFGANSETPARVMAFYTGMGNIHGPIVVFGENDLAPARALGEWVSKGNVSGPVIVFSANTSAVDAAIGRYSGSSVIGTRYINIVTQAIGGARGAGALHGGMPGYANGGMVLFRAAENDNPEIAHFANGGSALLSRDGLYAAPPHTLITPSNAVRGRGEGLTVIVQTGDFYGANRPDLDRWASEAIVPSIAEEFRRVWRAEGYDD